jgi:hypothetical protein
MASRFVFHRRGVKAFGRELDSTLTRRAEVRAAVVADFSAKCACSTDAELMGELERFETRIEAFTGGQPPGSWERWERLNRVMDGKLLLCRLAKVFDDRPALLARTLAVHLKARGSIDPELRDHVTRFERALSA